MSKVNQLQVTLKRSVIGRPADQKATVVALGLKRIRYTRIHDDTPAIRGMLNKVSHLVEVVEVSK